MFHFVNENEVLLFSLDEFQMLFSNNEPRVSHAVARTLATKCRTFQTEIKDDVDRLTHCLSGKHSVLASFYAWEAATQMQSIVRMKLARMRATRRRLFALQLVSVEGSDDEDLLPSVYCV